MIVYDTLRLPDCTHICYSWAAEKTRGKISRILERPPSFATDVILASALYFKAAWVQPFLPEATTPQPFFVSATEIVRVPTMILAHELPHVRSKELGCTMFSLAYQSPEKSEKVCIQKYT